MSGDGFRLTRRAEQQLADIYDVGIDLVGPRQAVRYIKEMEQCFALIAGRPRMGRPAKRLGDGVRRHEHASHVIFYETAGEGVLILAVVHRSSLQDLDL